MAKYFCDNLELKKESLKIKYVCKLNKKICPHVLYGVNGEAHPDITFIKRGCGLIKKEENNQVKKNEVQEKVIENKIENSIQKEERNIVNQKPQQNKKRNKNYIKQNQEQK